MNKCFYKMIIFVLEFMISVLNGQLDSFFIAAVVSSPGVHRQKLTLVRSVEIWTSGSEPGLAGGCPWIEAKRAKKLDKNNKSLFSSSFYPFPIPVLSYIRPFGDLRALFSGIDAEFKGLQVLNWVNVQNQSVVYPLPFKNPIVSLLPFCPRLFQKLVKHGLEVF